jgi:uncharacterized protein
MDLTDTELEELDTLLAEPPASLEPLDVVGMDGYLCAVLVQPRLVPPDEWLPPLLDVEGRSVPADVDAAWRERVVSLVSRRLAALTLAIGEDGWFDPLIPPADEEAQDVADPHAAEPADPAVLSPDRISELLDPWVSGFEYGLVCFPDLVDLVDDPAFDASAGLALGRVLRHLPPIDDEQRGLQALLDREQPLTDLDDAIDELVEAVCELWDRTVDIRFRVTPRRLEAPKVGRNDPCPCGSGRKFKRCHGA